MSAPAHVARSVGPKLVPFFKTVAVYFVLLMPADKPSWLAAMVKVLPILSLIVFVVLHGISFDDKHAFSRRIALGLLLSAVADALLVWPQMFLGGMAVFGVAHVVYISALGFHPLRPGLGAALYALGAWAVSFLVGRLDSVLLLGVPLYSALLVTMTWRAVARLRVSELWSWGQLSACFGGILFAVSDALIGFHMFRQEVPHSQTLIMLTYYAAQLGMALSVLDGVDRPRPAAARAKEMKEGLEQEQPAEGAKGLFRAPDAATLQAAK